jgi:poly-gamma-glutamate capsule biosynthesis protein CapA/YwtB (metallophosphatase superfamily)
MKMQNIFSLGFILTLMVEINPLLAQNSKPWPFVTKPKSGISILLMGDTNIQHSRNPEEAFSELIPTFQEADLKFVNLEGPFAGAVEDLNQSSIPHKDWSHSNPDQVRALTAAGIDGVGVANNVTYPWQDMLKSNEVLAEVGIPFSGGGKSKTEAEKPIIIEKNGVRVAFVQYATTVYPTNHAATEFQPGIAGIKVHTAYQAPPNLDKPGQPPIVLTWLDEQSKAELTQNLKRIKSEVDILIFSVHWGVSGTYEPVQYQHELGKLAIESGADVVMGHGTHRYQKVEIHQGRPILHGLGQGVFDDTRQNRSARYREGLMARLVIENGTLEEVSLVPLWRGDDDLVRLQDPSSGKGAELFELLENLSSDEVDLKIVGKEIRLDLTKKKNYEK